MAMTNEIVDLTAKTLVDAFTHANVTFSCAESCTGGLIAKKITDIVGASSMFLGGVVSYANSVKTHVLGVREKTLESVGAVSALTAVEMAVGVMKLTDSDYSVAVTGIAGPGGGSAEKPVGLVYIALASAKERKVFVTENRFSGTRDDVREATAVKALGDAYDLFASGSVRNFLSEDTF